MYTCGQKVNTGHRTGSLRAHIYILKGALGGKVLKKKKCVCVCVQSGTPMPLTAWTVSSVTMATADAAASTRTGVTARQGGAVSC